MLTEYINNAMSKSVYDKLKDGSFSGKIPQCPGVIAFGKTIDEAISALKEAVSLFFEDENDDSEYHVIGETLLREDVIHA